MQPSKVTIYQKLDWLIDQWCERRALRPLKFILRAYPRPLILTDDFGEVMDALRDVKGLCREELTKEELTQVISAMNELEDCMKR